MLFGKRVIFVILAGAVLGCFIFLTRDAEPSYQGKSLRQWMDQYCWPDNPTAADLFPRKTFFEQSAARQNEAAQAIRQIGTNAIPTLLQWEDQDSLVAWKVKLLAGLPKVLQRWQALNWWLAAQDQYRVTRALSGFYILGVNATPAVPELTRRMQTRNSGSGVAAAAALANMGAAALPVLLSALTNSGTPNRVMVLRCAANATRAASNDISGIRILAQCVLDTNAAVGAMAAIELGSITNQPGLAVPALIAGLKQPRGQVRARCVEALANYGAQARVAVPALMPYRNDPNRFVRMAASSTLQKLAPGP